MLERIFAYCVVGIAAPARVDAHVAAVGPAQLLQRLHEHSDAGLSFRIISRDAHQHADPPHPLGLLRTRRKWPRDCRAGKKGDESATLHVHPQNSGHGILAAKTNTLIGLKPASEATAMRGRCLSWVNNRPDGP